MIQTRDRILILADMHLKPLDAGNEPARRMAVRDNERLAKFLTEHSPRASHIVLLGDAFNFWFERRSRVVGDYSVPLTLFKMAAESGIELHHVSGNRDYAVGEGLGFDPALRYRGFLKLRWGFTVSRLADFGIEPHGHRFRLHHQGRNIAFIHGDSLCGNDRSFMAFRWLLQGPIGRWAMRWLPWGILSFFAHWWQGRIKPRRQRPEPWKDFSDQSIRKEIALGADTVVCGHLHVAHRQQAEAAGRKGTLHVIPAWMDGYFGVVENGELRVERFE